MSFTKDKYLIAATYYGDIILWDLETFEKSDAINIHRDCINDIEECKINFRLRSCIVTGSSDNTIKIISLRLDTEQFVEIATLKCDAPVASVAEAMNYIIVGAAKNKIYFWQLDNIEVPLKVVDSHTCPIIKLLSVDNGQYILSAGADCNVGVWRVKTLTLKYYTPVIHNECITDIIHVGDRIVTSSLDKSIKIHEIVYMFNNHVWET